MKKVFIYLLVVFSPLVLSLVGCSDDDYTSNSIVGLWEMTGNRNGWIPLQIVEEGDIVVEFTKDGKVKTLGKDEGPHPFNKNSTCVYSIVKIERSIFTGQSGKAVKITDKNAPKWSYFFSYSFSNDSLFLSQEAYDGWGYVFKRLR